MKMNNMKKWMRRSTVDRWWRGNICCYWGKCKIFKTSEWPRMERKESMENGISHLSFPKRDSYKNKGRNWASIELRWINFNEVTEKWKNKKVNKAKVHRQSSYREFFSSLNQTKKIPINGFLVPILLQTGNCLGKSDHSGSSSVKNSFFCDNLNVQYFAFKKIFLKIFIPHEKVFLTNREGEECIKAYFKPF